MSDQANCGLSRRTALAAVCAALAPGAVAHAAYQAQPRSRVIVDNDFGGDPDGLVQLAHQLLSPSAEVRAIIPSHLPSGLPQDMGPTGSAPALAKARALLQVMGLDGRYPLIGGADTALADTRTPRRTAAADAIIREAMREDTKLPLYYAAGAGLTDLATAWLIEPRIGKRLTLVWIGGADHPDLRPMPPAGPEPMEFNTSIDPVAAQVIFGQSDITIWQVPVSGYRQMLVGHAEIDRVIRPSGKVGAYLAGQVEAIMEIMPRFGGLAGETFIFGDSPLVLLTALQSSFSPDPSSSRYVLRPTPRLDKDGSYVARPDGRPMRVYTQLDMRLTYGDLIAKLQRAG